MAGLLSGFAEALIVDWWGSWAERASCGYRVVSQRRSASIDGVAGPKGPPMVAGQVPLVVTDWWSLRDLQSSALIGGAAVGGYQMEQHRGGDSASNVLRSEALPAWRLNLD